MLVFVLGGVVGNCVLVAVVMLLAATGAVSERGDYTLHAVVAAQFYLIVISLFPFRAKVDGVRLASDGLQVLQLLTAPRKGPTELGLVYRDMLVPYVGPDNHQPTFSSASPRIHYEVHSVDKYEDGAALQAHRAALERELASQLSREEKLLVLDSLITTGLISGEPGFRARLDEWSLRALQLGPEIETLRGGRGSVLVELGRWEEGKTILAKLSAVEGSFDLLMIQIYLARAEHALGNTAEAERLARAARATGASSPEHPAVRILLPHLEADLGIQPPRQTGLCLPPLGKIRRPSHPCPRGPYMARERNLRVEHLGEDLGGVGEAGAGAVEVGVAVGEIDAGSAHGREVGPAGPGLEQRQLLQAAGEVVAAGGDDDDVGVRSADLLPLHPAGMPAGDAEQIVAAGSLDQLRHPVAAGHQRLHPFDEGDAWPGPAGDAGGDGGDARLHALGERVASLGRAEGLGDLADVSVGIGERVGLQGDDMHGVAGPGAGCGLHVGEAHGAHLAMVLREDYVGGQGAKRVSVDAVDGEAVPDDGAHPGVNLRAGALHLEFRRRQRRQPEHLGREIALMAAADLEGAAPERVGDLSRTGDEAHDAGVCGGGHEFVDPI
jgi:hypothetical protein